MLIYFGPDDEVISVSGHRPSSIFETLKQQKPLQHIRIETSRKRTLPPCPTILVFFTLLYCSWCRLSFSSQHFLQRENDLRKILNYSKYLGEPPNPFCERGKSSRLFAGSLHGLCICVRILTGLLLYERCFYSMIKNLFNETSEACFTQRETNSRKTGYLQPLGIKAIRNSTSFNQWHNAVTWIVYAIYKTSIWVRRVRSEILR